MTIRKMTLVLMLLTLSSTLCAQSSFRPRLGVGLSNQLMNDRPAVSLKLQKSREFALGALANISTAENNGGLGAGIKFYRVVFEEPQLNFYFSGLAAMIKEKTLSTSKSGFQFDLTFGSEFSFQGLQSLGFSFEAGVSLNKMNEFVIETVGQSFVTAAVHFYL